MKKPLHNAHDEAALAAVLESLDGPQWEETLAPEARAFAPEWEALADDLHKALRMGPGGLTDAQREKIFAAAERSGRTTATRWSPPAPARNRATGRAVIWRLTAAAALVFGALALTRFIPVSGGIDSQAWVASLQARPSDNGGGLRVRVLSGEVGGSRYTVYQNGSARRLETGLPGGDWSATGNSGGFQPAAMANMAELVPAVMPDALPDVPEYFARDDRKISADGMINGFSYTYPDPESGRSLGVHVESGPCPWSKGNLLVQVGIKASSDPRIALGRHSLAARDVRLVVDFNPARVAAFRLIGKQQAAADDNSPVVAAGADLRAGQSVTAIYEVVPAVLPADAGADWADSGTDPAADGGDLLTARVLYRQPGKNTPSERQVVLLDRDARQPAASADFRFASAVAAYGMILDGAPGLQHFSLDDALATARGAVGPDPDGRRGAFVEWLGKNRSLR